MERLIAQRRTEDCAVSALAMLCHLRYEDVFVAAVRASPKWKRQGGLTMRELIATAKRLGRTLEVVHWRKVDLDEHVGVLGVNWNKPENEPSPGHWVVLRAGTIIDPVGPDVWDADEYLSVNNGRHGMLLIER